MDINFIFLVVAIIVLIVILKKVTSLIIKIILAAILIFYIVPHIGLMIEKIGYQLINSNTLPKLGDLLVNFGDILIF